MSKSKKRAERRERRKSKQQQWTRVPSGKVGHHANEAHFLKGAKIPCR
jgi:hypothetical protein